MDDSVPKADDVLRAYEKRSSRYDLNVNVFNLFRPFGFDIPAWRQDAVQALNLKPGDTVVDIGCGTGLNFPFLQEMIGSSGKIIGVDLSASMLEKARQYSVEQGWKNVELACSDAAQYEFPAHVDGILSTFALILVPDCGRVIANGCIALVPGGRFVVLDMAWPSRLSLNWRHVLFFLRSYGVSLETLQRRAWETVWERMQDRLEDFSRKRFWMGFMYLA
ncbi:MAG: class I SAM-dependent methyltransferase, partial [Anaerolineales bacterium]